MSLFDMGFAHDDEAKLLKFCPNKSLDYPNDGQACVIQTTTCF